MEQTSTRGQAGKVRVLVMDDEDVVRRVAKRMLAKLDYECAVADSGAEALEMYEQARREGRPFAAVILDLVVPGGMDGHETITRLKALDPGVKAIVSSGYSNAPAMAAFEGYGFRGAIAKPYSLEELSRVLAGVTAS
jgi:CheY-like chemotaxis protein